MRYVAVVVDDNGRWEPTDTELIDFECTYESNVQDEAVKLCAARAKSRNQIVTLVAIYRAENFLNTATPQDFYPD